MLSPISILAPLPPIPRALPRVVEPVCESTCNREEFPPTNPFALPPMPFAKFLERENLIDRFQKSPPRPIPCRYQADGRACPEREEWREVGRMIDVSA